MRPPADTRGGAAAALLIACSVSTTRFDGLPACDGDGDCEPGSVCVSGSCGVLPCDTSDDCGAGYQFSCRFGVCEAAGCEPGEPDRCREDEGYLCGAEPRAGGHWCELCVPSGREGPFSDRSCADGADQDCDGDADALDPDCAPCLTDEDCDDGDACTRDRCDPDAGCDSAVVRGPCDDGDPCTESDACAPDGTCAGDAVVCEDDGDPCTDEVCRPVDQERACVSVPNEDPCDDGDACTVRDACADGACAGAPLDCDDGDACTDDACDPGSGCWYADVPVDDGDACTDDACAPDTGAILHAPVDTDDGDPCTDDLCDPATGEIGHVPVPVDDSDACTIDACDPDTGVVVHGPVVCDDGNPCTDDVCDPAAGCRAVNNTRACDDGDACTAGDRCAGGACAGGPPPDCDDGNTCTDDACDPAAGCVHANNTVFCEDGSLCTVGDRCAGGRCAGGPPPDCDDANACTSDACVAAVGCVHANLAVPCDDGDACTAGDRCAGGACAGAPRVCPDDGDPCTLDTCDPATGACGEPAPDGTPCPDGAFCDGEEACAAGACLPGADPCDDGADCTADSCDEGADACANAPDDALCPVGQVCRPDCFAGGCGAPPASLALSCESPAPGASDCTIDLGGLSGQEACLSCASRRMLETFDEFAGFAGCSAGSYDGWTCEYDGGACRPADVCDGSAPGAPALAADDAEVAIVRTFDTSAWDRALLCFSYADRGATDSEDLEVMIQTDCGVSQVFRDSDGPRNRPPADDAFTRYCIDLSAVDPCAAGVGDLTVEIILDSDNPGARLLIDDVALHVWDESCVQEDVVYQSLFPCRACPVGGCGSGRCTDAGFDGWAITIDPPTNRTGRCCLAQADYTLATSGETWTIERTVDVSGRDGDVFVSIDYGEQSANDTAGSFGPDTVQVEFRRSPFDPWQEVFLHTGNVVSGTAMRRFYLFLSDLDPGVVGASALGVRITTAANGSAVLYLDNVRVGVLSTTCAPAAVAFGPIAAAGGGSYTVPATSGDAARVRLECSWDGVSGGASVEFR